MEVLSQAWTSKGGMRDLPHCRGETWCAGQHEISQEGAKQGLKQQMWRLGRYLGVVVQHCELVIRRETDTPVPGLHALSPFGDLFLRGGYNSGQHSPPTLRNLQKKLYALTGTHRLRGLC